MKNFIVIAVIALSVYLVSCAPSREKMQEKITKMESEMKSAAKADTAAVTELLTAYRNYAHKYTDDSLAPEYLYKAAGLALGFNRGPLAVDLYESIISTYPGYAKIAECYFMEAFAYENVIGNIGNASEYYNKFLAKYPEHELADDAQAAIKYLGKSPEEMVREFEKMNADSVAAAAK